MTLPNYLFYKVHEGVQDNWIWKRIPATASVFFVLLNFNVALFLAARACLILGLADAITLGTICFPATLLSFPAGIIYYAGKKRRQRIFEKGDELKEAGNPRYLLPGKKVIVRSINIQILLLIILFAL